MPRLRPGVDQNKSKTDTSFGVYINEGEMYKIQEWVIKHKNIETGVDLWPSDGGHYFVFGSNDHTAVVQFVLTPGKKCRNI